MLAQGLGGFSGPAIKPIALAMVYRIAREVSIPIIGCGGIETWEDAVEFFLAGASAVQIGTGTFRNPKTAQDVAVALETYLAREGLASLDPLIRAGLT